MDRHHEEARRYTYISMWFRHNTYCTSLTSGYCGGPLDKALSLDAIKQGDIEQIIKVGLLILMLATLT